MDSNDVQWIHTAINYDQMSVWGHTNLIEMKYKEKISSNINWSVDLSSSAPEG